MRREWAMLGMALLLAACGGTAPAQSAPAAPASGSPLQALIDGARKEGTLVVISSDETIGGPEAIRQFQAGFNKLYGLNVQIQYTPGPSMPEVTSKVVQEYKAQRPASTDVLIGAEAHVLTGMQAGALVAVDWASWAANIQDPRLLAPDGVAVEFSTATPGITYNTGKISETAAPRSLQDVLKPELKGRIASTPYGGIFADYATPEIWGEQRTLDFLRSFAPQVSGLIRAGETQRIASGEFDALAVNVDSAGATKLQLSGAPIKHVIPADAATLQFRYISVPKNAAHPNAAQLFINYLLGRDGQDVLFEHTASDQYIVPGSKVAPALRQVESAGVTLHPVDVQFLLRNDAAKLDAFNKQAVEILQKKS